MEQAKPRFLDSSEIQKCQSFRDAVRLAWDNRRRANMTQATFCEELDAYPSHMARWIHAEPVDKKGLVRGDFPARLIAEGERILGNRAMSQYLAMQAGLTLSDE